MQLQVSQQPGHWILAQMGKRVLRPGGRELTLEMLRALNITPEDDVLEIAPGLGFTAELTLAQRPRSYVAVDRNVQALERIRKSLGGISQQQLLVGDAAQLPLPSASVTKAYGEAMLTMQSAQQKAQIIGEARRVLKPAGLYGIHELALTPDTLDSDLKQEIQRALARVIKFQARPLTVREWQETLLGAGFLPALTRTNPMHLLEPKRVLDDEGMLRTFQIAFNVMTHAGARQRILAMRQVFQRYARHLCAVVIVSHKLSR